MVWEKKTERLTIRLTESERRALEERAEAFGVKLNFITHRMIQAGLRTQGSKRLILSANGGRCDVAS